MQEMNAIVDESTQTAFQSLPRIVREMESVRQEATILQEQMSLIKCDIEKEEKSTQESMCKLLTIDCQKKKLTQVELALQEADSWSQICDNIDNVMKSGDINKIADKIASLQHSLSMLSSTPDFEERQKKVNHLCDNFESLLGPQLIQSFFNNDSEFIRLGLGLLEKINRMEYGSKYYNAWFKLVVQDIWNQCKNNNQNLNAEDLLKLFFHGLLNFSNEELDKHIFPNNGAVVIVALAESIISLDEQFNRMISKSYPEIPDVNRRINLLVNCLQATDSFCEQLEISLQTKSSDIHQINPRICHELSVALYSQYTTVNDSFSHESEPYFQQHLNNIKMDSIEVTDSIDILDASINTVMELARESVRLCQSMTHFISVDALVDCLKNLFTNYIREFKRVALNIILKLSNQQVTSADHSDNIDSGMDDYYFLQDGIRLTSLGGHISINFEAFIKEMLSQISNHIQKIYSTKLKTPVFFRHYSTVLIESHTKRNQVTTLWKHISDTDSQWELLKLPNFKPLEETRQYVTFKLLRWLNKKVFDNAIEPVKKSLGNVHKLPIWQEELDTGESLPQFAFSPQEYITKIGQFLMTLPQQLEPFFINPNKYYQESLVNGQLPHMSDAFFNDWLQSGNRPATTAGRSDDGGQQPAANVHLQVAHVWLESIVAGCLVQLLEQWTAIAKLSPNGQHQLQADMNYIKGVVEDLDLQISPDLNMFSKLVVATTKDDIGEIATLHDIPPKMVEIARRILFR